MGLLGDIFSGAGKLFKGFLGIPTAPPPVPQTVPQVAATIPQLGPVGAALLGPVGQIIRAGGQVAQGIAAATVTSPAQLAAQRQAAAAGMVPGVAGGAMLASRGNGRFVKQTTVNTFDLVTGQVVRSVVLEGAPFLMNREVRALASVAKKVRKANAKIPSKTRKASALSELRDATVQQALLSVRATAPRALCPPG